MTNGIAVYASCNENPDVSLGLKIGWLNGEVPVAESRNFYSCMAKMFILISVAFNREFSMTKSNFV